MLYIITGPAGVGKSTISKKVAKYLPKSVLIEGDDIYHQVVGSYKSAWEKGNHLDIFWKVCIDIINDYLNEGYDVVFNYIINKDKFDELKKIFDDLKMIVLLVNEETIIKRDKQRPEDCQMKERCILLLNNFKKQNYDEKYILYTDNLNIDETYNEILNNDRFIVN